MSLTKTAAELAVRLNAHITGDGNIVLSDVTHDSREARPGGVFAAIKGLTVDGHRFIPAAVANGAVCVISEEAPPADAPVTWLQVEDARAAMAVAASFVFGEPSRELDLVGITGTNGKTTTTYLCFAAIEAAGRSGGMLTTVEQRLGGRSVPAARTTPEASDTNRFLREAVDAGCDFAVMESSSQALDLHRCDALSYRVAVFTNLTRDHLDYHGTMENYFDAKKMLFDGRLGRPPAACVVNVDDEYGTRLADELRAAGQRVVTFGIDSDADLRGSDISVTLTSGTSFLVKCPAGETVLKSPLVGRPHVYNILAAAATALELGVALSDIAKGIALCKGAPGRFERVENSAGFAVVVDYAHTDDALESTIRTARSLTGGKVITIFGCGGDRDTTKRAPMGRIAGELSDFTIMTSDNPRSEDPMKILRDIEEGAKPTAKGYAVEPDRRAAIEMGIRMAEAGDVVLICGKGHENYQIIGEQVNHFDDREVASEILGTL